MTALPPLLQAFFTGRLMTEIGASPHTLASYRDTVKLLLRFVHQRSGRRPDQLQLADLDAATISAFLQHLETDRHNSVATRNTRLAAIHALFRYASLHAPDEAELIARVLAIQTKRTATTTVHFLDHAELEALLAAPDLTGWHGRRDHALLVLAAQTGLRVSELTGLALHDLHLGTGAHVRCHGKGRKDRATPLTSHTIAAIAPWRAERLAAAAGGTDPLFCTRTGRSLSRDAVSGLVAKHAATAAQRRPSMRTKIVTPHVLRHSAAMNLLHAGVDITVIALWLGHEDPTTTKIYLHADMALKEQAIARTTPPGTPPARYQPTDTLLAFLDQL